MGLSRRVVAHGAYESQVHGLEGGGRALHDLVVLGRHVETRGLVADVSLCARGGSHLLFTLLLKVPDITGSS